jgi:hypothetical protein
MRTQSVKVTYIALIVGSMAALLIVPSAQAGDPGPPSGNGVQPAFVAGNPDCEDIGLGYGFKVDGGPNGTFSFTSSDGTLTGGALEDPNSSVTISNSDGSYFDWASTLGLDAVIVKGGPNANVYYYDPEATSDTNLHSPINPSNNTPFGLSHIEFCYDYELDVDKSADPTFTRTYDWTITKEYDGEYWMFAGESVSHDYRVSVARTGYTDSAWAVSGTVTIENNTPFDATITSINDVISGIGAVAVDCGGISYPYVLASGESLECTYGNPLPDGTSRVNTATVTTSGAVGGDQATADIVFGEPTTEANAEINVGDTNGGSWMASGDAYWDYSWNFDCSTDLTQYVNGTYSYTHNNVATITETGQWDDATVTVHCYIPNVEKDAYTEFKRTWEWTIDKQADQSELTLSPGQQFLVNYDVIVDATSFDSDWFVYGTITIDNPNPNAPMTVALSDDVGGITATLLCDNPLTVGAGGTGYCDYEADLPNGDQRTNTATATLNGIAFSGDAEVIFGGDPEETVDACVDVFDTRLESDTNPTGFLGEVCAGEVQKVFQDAVMIGPYSDPLDCGYFQVPNTASFEAEDTQSTDEATWIIDVTVPCDVGCTLTPGYWKTHSIYGPAPYDDTWTQIGEDTPFFLSGQSYYDVLWTQPKGGNAYYILAHAYIAAELNYYNGASFDDAQSAFDAATALFEAYTPDEIGALKNKPADRELREDFIEAAAVLDYYNNGIIGPGHCSE